jgi:hypothetical protein
MVSKFIFYMRRTRMKRFLIVVAALAMVMGIGIGSASAANSL